MSEKQFNISSIIERIAADIKNTDLNSKEGLGGMSGIFKWKRLSTLFSNEKLTNEFIKIYVSENVDRNDRELLVNESFCQQFKNGYMFVFVFGVGKTTLKSTATKYILAAQSNKYAKIVELNDTSSLQSDLIRIVNLIDRQISNIDKFIEDYINGDIF